MNIYFDHAAAQLPSEKNIKIISENLRKYGANAENRHFASYAVRHAQIEVLKKCMDKWHMQLGTDAVFFSSGSEIFRFIGDFLNTLPNGNIVANVAMHPAFIAMLKRTKHEVRMVRFTENSELDTEDLKSKCDKNTRFFAHWHVHSETGLIADIETVRKTVKNINPEIIFFIDTIQSFGKMPMPGADLWTASGHKIGVAASAALFFRKNSKYDFERMIFDYRHEDYLMGRPENAMIISMFECAAENADDAEKNDLHCRMLKKVIIENLPDGVKPTFSIERTVSHILHLQLPPYDGAVVAGLLSERGAAVSPGSACTAEARTPSATLKALNIKNPYSVLRLSFAPENTVEECTDFCRIFKDVLQNY